jgi:hypothetical protein
MEVAIMEKRIRKFKTRLIDRLVLKGGNSTITVLDLLQKANIPSKVYYKKQLDKKEK